MPHHHQSARAAARRSLAHRFSALRTGRRPLDDAVDARIDQLDARLAEVGSSQDASLQALERRLEALAGQLDTLERQPEALDRIDALDRRLETLDGLTVELMQGVDRLRRDLDPLVGAARSEPYMEGAPFTRFTVPGAGQVLGYRDGSGEEQPAAYRAFEDVFRGSEERVRELQRPYLALIGEREPVLDLGCGRGEFLDLLKERGITYVGIDPDAGMVERCRAKGHEHVELADAASYLERQPESQLEVIFSAQVIEHMLPAELERVLDLARGALSPDGLLIAETVNPHAPDALKAFWVDPTHQHPIFPEVALVLCRIAGFRSAYVFFPGGSGDVDRDRESCPAYAVVAGDAA